MSSIRQKIKAAHLVRLELFSEGDRPLQHFVLLLEADFIGTVQVRFRTVRRWRRTRPIHLVERAADVSYLQLVLRQDLLRFRDLRIGR